MSGLTHITSFVAVFSLLCPFKIYYSSCWRSQSETEPLCPRGGMEDFILIADRNKFLPLLLYKY